MTEYTEKKDSVFKKFILYSCVFHIVLALILIYKDVVFKSDDIVLISAIRVDIVDLPDKVKPKPAAVSKPAPKAKPAPKPKPKPKKKFSAKSQNRAFESLKARQTIEKMKKQQAAIEKAKQLANAEKELEREQQKIKKGNIISDSSGLSGLDRLKMNEYYEQVRVHIHSHFEIPSFLMNQNFNAKAVININSLGQVLVKSILESSGHEIFDNAVLTAIDNASPLPPPPDRLKRQLEKDGFILGFPE